MLNPANLILNNVSEPPHKQFSSINYMGMQLNTMLQNSGSNLIINYTQPQGSDFTMSSVIPTIIPTFTFPTNINNTNCDVRVNFTIQGAGKIIVKANKNQIVSRSFNSTGFTPISINQITQLPLGNVLIQVLIQSVANGSNIVIANSKINNGDNIFQLMTLS